MRGLPTEAQKLIRAELERMTCPVHGAHPIVTFTDSEVSVECCCKPFYEEVHSKAQSAIVAATERYIKNAFKKWGVK